MQPVNPTLTAPYRDPAPSKTAYRMQRLWLIPTVRRALRVGLPTFVIIYLIAAFILAPARQKALIQKYTEISESIKTRPEFTVQSMQIDGASDALIAKINAVVPLQFPVTAFDLDLEDMRAKIAAIDAVKAVSLKIGKSGVLSVKVTERQPVVVWRGPDGLKTLDNTGHAVTGLDTRRQRGDLPLIAGEGAELASQEALELFAAAAPIQSRIIGLARIGERRWDLVLTRNQRILLPALNPVPALERVMVLNAAQDMLARDLVIVDMRLEKRPTIRVAPTALAALQRIKKQELGD